MTDDRRRFLASTAVAAGTAWSLSQTAVAAADKDRSKITCGLIGCGGRGVYLARLFASQANVDLKYVCDVDRQRLDRAKNLAAHAISDFRKLLDDKSVDAVLVATPDHWHAPASILACDAGKHVYVEKPCSHNVREGKLLVEAARRNQRVVQHGTQVRSTDMMIEAVKHLRQGVIGKVLVAKAWNIQRRRSIGRQQPEAPPSHLDYDQWVGPATMLPYQRNRVHGGWHWWRHFGTGDMGNDGVHDIDYARWGLGVDTHPSLVSALGGKFFFDDDQEFPDTQQVAFEYPGSGNPGDRRILIYEQRLWSTNYPHNVDSGVEFYGDKGQMFLSRRGKIQVLGERNKEIDLGISGEAQNAEKHAANFLHCVRTGEPPNGEIELGHLTASLCHLGNIATRLQRSLRFDPAAEQVLEDKEANRLVSRAYRTDHWANPEQSVRAPS